MSTIQGFMLIDVDVAALNNAGNDTSTSLDNAVMTKKIKKNGKEYPYVSGQAWRYWWREALIRNFKWDMSPVVRESKIAFTEANPIKYPDDDIFGYMRAAKIEIKDEETGKIKKENITLTRVSPLKNSALLAISYNPIIQNWSSMTRQDGDAVPYGKDEYCAIMKGMFSIDLEWTGTFSMQNRSGFMNLNENLRKEALLNGKEIEDNYLQGNNKTTAKLIRLNDDIRKTRIGQTILALKFISGGAKQATNMADVAPKLIILAQFKSGNHPFSHLAKEELGLPVFSIDALHEVLREYKDHFIGSVFIGKRKGFMDDLDEKLAKLNDEFSFVEFAPINESIDAFVKTIKLD